MIYQKKGKKAQMKLSFGMIFSIFLIILFLIFAFYAIKKFIFLQQDVQIKSFVNDLQTDINRAWKEDKASATEQYSLPDKIEEVCFEGGSNEITFKPISEKIPEEELNHINIEDSFCVDNTNGKINLIISKNSGEALVKISKP